MQMAAKRIRNPFDELSDEPTPQRRKTVPSFAEVIKTVMMMQSTQNLVVALEPMLRRVVREEVEKSLVQIVRTLNRSGSGKQLMEAPQSSALRLVFVECKTIPIFTGSKIEDLEGNPLRLQLVDASTGKPYCLSHAMKVEIVVVDGDFAIDGRDRWTREEFDRSVLRERAARRPLLNGEVVLTMRGSEASLGDISITDNSSWVRSRHFRIGARVVAGSGTGSWIQEAITERFVVRDHRGESYKKSYPPMLDDEVWRLEKIAKDGAFHRRLASAGINTVQDFLKLWVVDPLKLRSILDTGMSDKMWEVTSSHAKTCLLGDKLYVYRKMPNCTVVFNAACQALGSMVDGIFIPNRSVALPHKGVADELAYEAYNNWCDLQVYEGLSVENVLLQPSMMEGEREFVSPHEEGGFMITNCQTAEFEFNMQGASFPENPEVNCFWLPKMDYHIATSDVPQNLVYSSKAPEFSSSDDEGSNEGSSLSQAFFLN